MNLADVLMPNDVRHYTLGESCRVAVYRREAFFTVVFLLALTIIVAVLP